MASSSRTFAYKKPHPFVLPNKFTSIFENSDGSKVVLPRETLFYSAQVLEEIMRNINDEYDARGVTRPTWKLYRAGTDDYISFTPNPNGNQMSRVAIKFFPAIVKDIQDAIDVLINDSAYGDTRASFFARTFGNNTIHTTKTFWSSSNRIRDGYVVPATNAQGFQTLNPLTNIVAGQWAFPVDRTAYSGAGHVENPLCRLGVDFHGDSFIKNEAGSIETSASGWPASVIGKRRTEQNVAIVNGRLISKQGSSVTGIDGIELPMKPEGRPGPHLRKNTINTSQGVGAGTYDPDAGYGFLAHHPFVIQQLRWQPPIIEKFDGPETIPDENYTQKIWSNTSINIPYILAHPQERMFFMNWGNWLIKGKAKNDNTGLTLNAIPDQYNGFVNTQCPFSVFYPPSTVNCTCSVGDTSYAVWGCDEDPLIWNLTNIFQSGGPRTKAKRIGPKTRIRVKHTYQPLGGSPNPRHYYSIMVRITSVGSNNLQPFIPIYVAAGSNPQSTLPGIIAVQGMTQEGHGDGSFSLNIIEAIKKSYPQYSQDSDFILSLAIFVHHSVSGQKTCGVIDLPLPVGSIPDPSCTSSLTCTLSTIQSKTSYIQLFEPPLEYFGDPRLP